MVALPALPTWVAHERTAWFILEGLLIAAIGGGLTLAGPRLDPSLLTLGRLSVVVGLATAAIGTFTYGLLMVRDRLS